MSCAATTPGFETDPGSWAGLQSPNFNRNGKGFKAGLPTVLEPYSTWKYARRDALVCPVLFPPGFMFKPPSIRSFFHSFSVGIFGSRSEYSVPTKPGAYSAFQSGRRSLKGVNLARYVHQRSSQRGAAAYLLGLGEPGKR